jgi:type I restriction enzyme S subunit
MFGAPGDVSPSFSTQPLGNVCRFYAGNSLPEGVAFTGQVDGVLHVKVGDMNLPGNESVVSTSREWSANGAGGIIAPKGAILIPKRGGAIATNKKRVLGRPCALDPNLMAISPGPDLRQELLFQWFKLFDLSTITSGSAVPQLNKGDLAPLRIVVPPKEQQNRFAAIAQRVTSIKNRQAIQLSDIESASRALTDELLAA